MKQQLLRIALPEGKPPLRATALRELLARKGDGSPLLPPQFFHYGDDGRPLSAGVPEIRTVGGRAWVGLLGISEDTPYFDSAVGIAIRVVSDHYGLPLPISVERPEVGLQSTEDLIGGQTRPITYYLRDMAIKRRTPSARNQPIEDLVRQRMLRGLVEMAARHNLDLPADGKLGLVFHELREVGLRLSTTTGPTNEYVGLVNGEFSMNVALTGIWQVGNLQARGYGRIVRKTPGAGNFRVVNERGGMAI